MTTGSYDSFWWDVLPAPEPTAGCSACYWQGSIRVGGSILGGSSGRCPCPWCRPTEYAQLIDRYKRDHE